MSIYKLHNVNFQV